MSHGAYINEPLVGSAKVSWVNTIGAGAGRIRVGLCSTRARAQSVAIDDFSYALEYTGGNYYYVEPKAPTPITTPQLIGPATAAAVPRIFYDGRTIVYQIDGVVVREVDIADNLTWFTKVCIEGTDWGVDGFTANNYTQNNWSAISGSSGAPEDSATRNAGRGPYSSSTAYAPGDIVVWEASSGGDGNGYIRIGTGNTTGTAPTDTSKWAVLVNRGSGGLSGYLTNETHTVATPPDGIGGDFSGANGNFKVFLGTTDVTAGCTFTKTQSEPLLGFGGVVDDTLNEATGAYSVTGGLNADSAWVDITAEHTASSQTITKRFTVSKSKTGTGGAAAKVAKVVASHQLFPFNTDGQPETRTITFTSSFQGLNGHTIWRVYRGSDMALWWEFDSQNATNVSNGSASRFTWVSANQISMTQQQFVNALEGMGGGESIVVEVYNSGDSAPVKVDRVSIQKVQDGAAGADALTGYLTNEAHTVPADMDGNIQSVTGSNGLFKVYLGTEDVTGACTFGKGTATGIDSLKFSISSTGAYNPTALDVLPTGTDSGTIELTATHPSSITPITKVYTLSKSKAGGDAPIVKLTASSQQFKFDTAGNALAHTVTFALTRQHTTGDVEWVARDGTRTSRGLTRLTFSGDTATLTHTDFAAWCTDWSTNTLTLEATVDGVTDKVSVVKVQDGAKGSTGDTGPTFAVTPTASAFTYINGVLTPASQTISFSAKVDGVTTAVAWTTSPSIKSNASAAGFSISAAEMGANQQLVVTATHNGVSVSNTITKMADVTATPGAVWGDNVSSRPIHLTDSRVPDALDDAGFVKSGIRVPGAIREMDPSRLIMAMAGMSISVNPEFADGTATGYRLYDNNGTGKVTMAVVADSAAPNASGNVLRISYSGPGAPGSVAPSPGWGGTSTDIAHSSVPRPGFYQEGNSYLVKIRAKIPTGRSIGYNHNPFGTGGEVQPLTPLAGTGVYAEYSWIYRIGVGGTLSTWGHIDVEGGVDTAFSWDIAKYDILDLSSASRTFTNGAGIYDDDGARQSRDTLVTARGTAKFLDGEGTLARKSSVTFDSNDVVAPTRLLPHPDHGLNYLQASVIAFDAASGSNTVQSLRPQEASANVTENRRAKFFNNQAAWATLGVSPTEASQWLPVGSSDGNYARTGSGFKKLTEGSWSNSAFITRDWFERGARATMTVLTGAGSNYSMLGLTSDADPITNVNTYQVGDYLIYAQADNGIYKYNNGTPTRISLTLPVAGDTLEVRYFGTTVGYYLNGTLLYEDTVPAGQKLRGLFTSLATGASFSNVVVTPYADGEKLDGVESAADVTKSIKDGPNEIIIKYNSDGTAAGGELPKTATYKLTTSGGTAISSGVSWALTVISGTVSAAMAGSGTGQLSISSLSSNEAVITISATHSGRVYYQTVKLVKQTAAATSAGGGGSTGGTEAFTETFTSFNSATVTAVTGELTVTIGSTGAATLTASNLNMDIITNTGPTGSWNCRYTWQWLNGATWTDVVNADTHPDPQVTYDSEFANYTSYGGAVTCNGSKTGLTAGTSHKFRLVARYYTSSPGHTVWTTGRASVQG